LLRKILIFFSLSSPLVEVVHFLRHKFATFPHGSQQRREVMGYLFPLLSLSLFFISRLTVSMALKLEMTWGEGGSYYFL
jgi:hypothetical protein